jgi:hypothetical protein
MLLYVFYNSKILDKYLIHYSVYLEFKKKSVKRFGKVNINTFIRGIFYNKTILQFL